jgi:hypothetical protein
MNLVPIEAGGTPPTLTGSDAPVGGDFAALMTGLMSGDTQIVPLLDLPIGDQPAAEGRDAGTAGEDAASLLEFVGTPPSGILIGAQIGDAAPSGPTVSTGEVPGSTDDTADAAAVLVPAGLIAVMDETAIDEAAVDSAVLAGLATVHPISNRATPGTVAESAEPLGGVPLEAVAGGTAPQGAGPETEGGLHVEPTRATPNQTEVASVARPTAPTSGPIDGQPVGQSVVAAPQMDSNVARGATAEPRSPDLDVEVDTGLTTRPTDTARPFAAIPQPAMVGIARRVEEAIAALATKPDPRIVTLQLDELDGLRLTVALRADGLHLSSTGDPGLTTEIERALAARGFDMASGRDGERRGTEDGADDGWRPQPAAPNRQNRTNPSGIRL